MEKKNNIYCSTCQDWGTLNNGKICLDCPDSDSDKNLRESVAGPIPPSKFVLAIVGAHWVSTPAKA